MAWLQLLGLVWALGADIDADGGHLSDVGLMYTCLGHIKGDLPHGDTRFTHRVRRRPFAALAWR